MRLLACLAFLASLAIALPATDQSDAVDIASMVDTHRVHLVAAGKKLPPLEAMKAAYRKYNASFPTDGHLHFRRSPVVAATTTTSTATLQSSSVAATDLPNDKAYFVNVTVGKTRMLLNMDTGSSDLWAFSTLLPSDERGKHALYPLSGTIDQGESWEISYGDGSGASGIVYADKVAIGKVTATVQAVEAATSVSSSFTTGLQDGIVGLGFEEGNTCSPYSCYTFMQQVAPTLPKALFTATLRHNAPGEYDIGFIDTSKYTGALTYNSLTDDLGAGYWEFYWGAYSIGSGAKVSYSMLSIADTGTSLCFVDQQIVNAFYAPVTGATYSSTYGGVVFPCSSTSKLPNLSLWVNGVKHTMPGSFGVYLKIGDAANTCFGGVQADTNIGFSIIGDVFLKSQFVVFDLSVPRIGWAQQKGVTV